MNAIYESTGFGPFIPHLNIQYVDWDSSMRIIMESLFFNVLWNCSIVDFNLQLNNFFLERN